MSAKRINLTCKACGKPFSFAVGSKKYQGATDEEREYCRACREGKTPKKPETEATDA